MDEQQPAQSSPGPASAVTAQPAAAFSPVRADRGMVIAGGLLAGLGLGIAIAFLMHVVQQFSPSGSGMTIEGSVLAEVFVAGPIFGLGLALALTALIPPANTSSQEAGAGPANPADHPDDV